MIRQYLTCAVAALLLAPNLAAADPQFKMTAERIRGLSPAMQQEIGHLQYLLNAHQTAQFFRLPDDAARRSWVKQFWASQDPTPTTEVNEKRDEHIIRVRLAKDLFGSKRFPGWDKRGEVFIRYGMPNYRGIISAEVTTRKTRPPGELWYYTRHGMIVKFSDETLNGHYLYSITPLGAAQDMNADLIEYLLYDISNDEPAVPLAEAIPSDLLTFYRDPEIDPDSQGEWTAVHTAINGLQPVRSTRLRMRGVSEDIGEVTSGDYLRNLPDNPSEQFLRTKAEDLAAEFEVVLEETPTAYPFNFNQQAMPFFFGVDQFKGGDGVNRVEVNLQFPIGAEADTVDAPSTIYVAEAVFTDAAFNEVGRERREITIPKRSIAEGQVQLFPAQMLFSLSNDYYRVGVSMQHQATGRESAYRTNVKFNDYDRPTVTISDILFARKIAPAERQSPFNRGALEVIPHPIRRYQRGDVVPIYFEVYNLDTGVDDLTSYTVEYRIVPHSPKRTRFWDRFGAQDPVVSSKFSSSGYARDEPLHISVRTDNLWQGAFDFLVTVKDNTNEEITFRRATFRVVN